MQMAENILQMALRIYLFVQKMFQKAFILE